MNILREEARCGAERCWLLAGIVAIALFLAVSGAVQEITADSEITQNDITELNRELEAADEAELNAVSGPKPSEQIATSQTGKPASALPASVTLSAEK